MYLQLFKMTAVTLIVFLLVMTNYAESANILYVIPFSAMSHYIFLKSIGLELAHRGHNVTVITTFMEKNPPPNYRQISVVNKNMWELIGEGAEAPNIFDLVDLSPEEFQSKIHWPGGVAFTDLVLSSPEVVEFLKKDNQFDLVICEQFFQEALYTLSVKYNAPLAIISTFGNCMRHNLVTRNPLQLATVVGEYLSVNNPRSFSGRLRNFYFTVYEYFWWRYWYLDKQEQLVPKYFPELVGKTPSLYDLQKDASIMLINSHFSYDTPFALLPNIVEIGGAHLSRSNTSLPEDLQKLLDESKHGVVYVSFGSNVRSADLPEEKKKAFLNVFKKLKQTVVWKWEEDILEGKPNNLVIRKWFPQKEILAHPNIKVFIAHGGLIGMQETIFNGVPVVGIPIYSDQHNNLVLAEEAGFGKLLQYHDITEKNLDKALHDVLNNDSYMKKAKELQKIWKDRPMSPLDTAMFWLEYVIRNKGAEYIKNPARNMNWFAYNMVDVYAFILAILTIVIALIVKVISTITIFLFGDQVKTTTKKKRS
ncbi:UDP-glycosyltransferase UGT5-like [Pararge aegeria]|uniref:UDP-glycosyltransferase UGT5-like n=1 Tax=Pararge aegeria TaxID=116150 RepID=UPI0019D115F6|nr:UDP-glycosyltransferase UGT5-like [Pararge aegeria]